MNPSDFFDTHPVFTHGEFVSVYTAAGRSRKSVNPVLRKHLVEGRILRVRRGIYASVPRGVDPDKATVDPYLVATRLADDAVVVYHGALQFHGKVHSVWPRLHYLTRVQAEPFSFRGFEFMPVRTPLCLRDLPDGGGGIIERPHAGGTVRVTTLERTLVDVFDSVKKGGGWAEVWRSLELVEHFDLDAVIDYIRKLDSTIVAARVGFFLDQNRGRLMVEQAHLRKLKALGPKVYRYIDPKRQTGKLVPSWNLIVSEQMLSGSWDEVP